MPLFAPFEYTHIYCIINYDCVCKLFFISTTTYLDIYLPRLPLYYFEYMYLYAEKIVCSSSFVNSLVIISIILPKTIACNCKINPTSHNRWEPKTNPRSEIPRSTTSVKSSKHANQQTNFLCRGVSFMGGSRDVKVAFGAQASNFQRWSLFLFFFRVS